MFESKSTQDVEVEAVEEVCIAIARRATDLQWARALAIVLALVAYAVHDRYPVPPTQDRTQAAPRASVTAELRLAFEVLRGVLANSATPKASEHLIGTMPLCRPPKLTSAGSNSAAPSRDPNSSACYPPQATARRK